MGVGCLMEAKDEFYKTVTSVFDIAEEFTCNSLAEACAMMFSTVLRKHHNIICHSLLNISLYSPVSLLRVTCGARFAMCVPPRCALPVTAPGSLLILSPPDIY